VFIFFLVSTVIGGADHGVCVHDGSGCTTQAERHGEVDAQAAIKISVANAIHPPSSQYGVYDADFLKGNIVEVRQGHYEAYFSERVWSENAQHFTITLLVEVFGYDMGARFKDFAADAARSCVTLQMPDDYDNPFGQGDAIICGHKSYSFTYLGGSKLHQPLLFFAILRDPHGAIVAESDTMVLEFVALPSWRPPPLQAPSKLVLAPDITPEDDSTPHHMAGAPQDRVAVTFLAEEREIDTFLAHLEGWRSVFAAHLASARTSTETDSSSIRWALHVFVAEEALQALERSSSSAQQLLMASSHIPFQVHICAQHLYPHAAPRPGTHARARKVYFMMHQLLAQVFVWCQKVLCILLRGIVCTVTCCSFLHSVAVCCSVFYYVVSYAHSHTLYTCVCFAGKCRGGRTLSSARCLCCLHSRHRLARTQQPRGQRHSNERERHTHCASVSSCIRA